MVGKDVKGVADEIRSELGDDLIGIGHYEGKDWEVFHIREDFVADYPPERLEQVANDLFFEAMAKHQQDDLYDFGGFECSIRQFRDAFVVHIPLSDTEGVGVVLVRQDFDGLSAVTDRIIEFREAVEAE